MKTCTKCGIPKPATLEFFYACKAVRSGLKARCRLCDNAMSRAWRIANPEAAKKDKRGPKEWREKMRRYRATHRDQWDAYMKDWLSRNAERNRHYARNRRALINKAPGHHTVADVQAQRTRQRGRCYWCGVKVGRHYHVDHVIPLSKGGDNGPGNIVIACPPCNWHKHARLPSEVFDRLC